MKVLFVASEVAPFSKTGGLADVAQALPVALAKLGVEVTVVTPLYRDVPRSALAALPLELPLRFPFGARVARLRQAKLSPGCRVLFVEDDELFGRDGLYEAEGHEYSDNHQRFAFFSVAALAAAQALDLRPDVIHLNDWHTALAALAVKRGFGRTSLGRAGVVFTLHNVAYQGRSPLPCTLELGLPFELAGVLEHQGELCLIKAGLLYADRLTTVSERYAQEIQTLEGGFGLDPLIRARQSELSGILNGIDVDEWNPKTDALLAARYDAKHLGGKAACKRDLLKRLRLPEGAERRPLLGTVSRLAHQKGIDLLVEALPAVLARHDAYFVGLGRGEPALEHAVRELQARLPDRVRFEVGFDGALAHRIEAGCDFFVMPSRFEPCGLNQMYSLRYGTIPVVRATGGLDDTVIDLSLPDATGVKFDEASSAALAHALDRALGTYADSARLQGLRQRGMRADFSWERSATQYQTLYQAVSELD